MTNPLDMSGTLSLGTPSAKLAPKQRKALRMAIEMLMTVYRGKRIYETEQLMRVADFCQEALDQTAEEQMQEQVSRLEVIDAEGRSYTNWLVTKLKLSYQDEDKTLKIFTDGASETKYTKPLAKSWESKCKCEQPTQEPVYTNSDRTMTMEDRNFTSEGGGYIQDNNFDFDAGLRIDGDFVDAERDQYAQMLCNALNAHQEVKKSLAVQKPDRTGMVYCRNETCKAENADSIDCICWSPESVVLNNQTTQKPNHICRYSRATQSYPRKCLDCNEAESQPETTTLNNQTVQKPLSGMKILELADEYRLDAIMSDAINFARAIEKAHGIGE